MYTPKVIADPVYGIIDIRPVLPMVSTEEFQALSDKRQLGLAYLIFPSATHTRMAHSLGAYHATQELARRWQEDGLITEREARALGGYALYHDIGHPPFSHVTEDLCEKDNDGLGLDIMRKHKKEIEASGIDFKLLIRMAEHKDPLYLAVHDKNLGMEKLDYLERDGLYTILSRPSGIDYLRKHIYFMHKELVIDEKVVDNAIEVQNFYIKMYKNVYLRKASVISQRMMQKLVYYLVLYKELSRKELPKLTDGELIGRVAASKVQQVKALYGFLKRRELFREVVVIRPEEYAEANYAAGKAITVFGADKKFMKRIVNSKNFNNKNQDSLLSVERAIAKLAGIPEEAVLVVGVFNPWRFTPKDIAIHLTKNKTASLKERYPAHFKGMEETALAYFALRIATLEKYRKKLSRPAMAKKIYNLIVAHL